MNIERRIKIYLNQIIDAAYPNMSKQEREKALNFTIIFDPQEKRSYHGLYMPKNKTGSRAIIKVGNFSRGDKAVIITCLHETAHHIDAVFNGRTGHQAPFYEAYERLIYAAMNLRLLTPDDFREAERDAKKVGKGSQGFSKVLLIVARWEPHYLVDEAPAEKKTVKVGDGFSVKDQLKNAGFYWNKISSTWDIETDNPDETAAFVREIGCKKIEISDGGINIANPMVTVVASGKGTYEHRNALRENRFMYNKKKKVWEKRVPAEEASNYLAELKQLNLLGIVFSQQ